MDRERFKTLQTKCEGFELELDREYLIRFYTYQPHYENFSSNKTAKLTVASETRYIRYLGEGKIRMPLGQRIYSKDFEFWTKDVIMGGKSKIILERVDDEFNAPSTSLYFSLPKNIPKILVIFVFLTLGLLMVGASDLLFQMTGLPKLLWSSIGAVLSSTVISLLEYLRRK